MQKLKFQRELSEEELERLVEYTRRKEREPPLAFVGRDDIRSEIIGQVDDRLKATDTVSRTFVIKGAPGCGKTSLLSQFKLDIAHKENAYAVPIKTSELNEPALFLESFVSELVKGYERKAFSSKETTNKTTGEALFIKQEREWKAAMPSLVERLERKSSSIWKVLKELLNLKNNPVFLLLVDEAQRTRPLQGTSENTIATELHLGETDGIKIIPVFAGLSDTPKVLGRVGVSLRSEVTTLGALTEHETELVVWKTIAELKVIDLFRDNDFKTIMEQCTIASEQWPRHLDQYLKTLVKAIVAGSSDSEIDLDRVISKGHENRMAYYDVQLSRLKTGRLVATLVWIAKQHEVNAPILSEDVLQAIEDDPWIEESPNMVLNHLLHHGILEDLPFTVQDMKFSIPSLHTYLANDCDRERVLAEMDRLFQERLNERK